MAPGVARGDCVFVGLTCLMSHSAESQRTTLLRNLETNIFTKHLFLRCFCHCSNLVRLYSGQMDLRHRVNAQLESTRRFL